MQSKSNSKNLHNTQNFESSGAFKWDPIIYFYVFYIFVLLIGGLTGRHVSNYGAAIFLILLYGYYWTSLFQIKIDALSYCILLCLLIPLIPMVHLEQKTILATAQELIKYIALHLVILLGSSLPLTPLGRASKGRLAYGAILLFLITGCLWNIAQGQIAMRINGFQPNPNGFALTAMMLLFLTDMDSSQSLRRFFSKVIVIFLILITRTSGALLGLLVGFSYQFWLVKPQRIIRVFMLTVIIGIVIWSILILPKGTLPVIDTSLEKLETAQKNLNRAFSGKSIDFYNINESKGSDVTSALWRIYQWNKILIFFMNSSLDKILFGYGIGTTDILFKLKAHNNYIRILFETGIVGFILNMFVWILLYRRMDLKYRSLVIMVSVFCLTENNYDHFPAMSLLAFFMLSTKRQPAPFNHNIQFNTTIHKNRITF